MGPPFWYALEKRRLNFEKQIAGEQSKGSPLMASPQPYLQQLVSGCHWSQTPPTKTNKEERKQGGLQVSWISSKGISRAGVHANGILQNDSPWKLQVELRRQVLLDAVEISVAYSAGANLHQDLPFLRGRLFNHLLSWEKGKEQRNRAIAPQGYLFEPKLRSGLKAPTPPPPKNKILTGRKLRPFKEETKRFGVGFGGGLDPMRDGQKEKEASFSEV